MSLSSDGAVMTMPVTPAYQGGNGGFGGWGGDWASWIILFLIIISNDGSVLLQKRKRNCGSLLFVICTVGQLFTKRLVLIIWKKEMRLLPL